MRFLVGLLSLVVAGSPPAFAREYRNLDSLIAGGLIFVGGTDRYEYGYLDTVHAVYRVVNRRVHPIVVTADVNCPPEVDVTEEWCDSSWVACPVGVPPPRPCIVPFPRGSFMLQIAPGESTLAEFSTTSPYVPIPGNTLRFRRAVARFESPWWVPPRFSFEVAFRRNQPTPLSRRSWSAVKSLFR